MQQMKTIMVVTHNKEGHMGVFGGRVWKGLNSTAVLHSQNLKNDRKTSQGCWESLGGLGMMCFRPSCLYLPRPKITGLCHHVHFNWRRELNPRLGHARQTIYHHLGHIPGLHRTVVGRNINIYKKIVLALPFWGGGGGESRSHLCDRDLELTV